MNVIKKVWQWIKEELKKLPFILTSKEELVREIQRLWDQVDLRNFRKYTKRLTYKLEDVISIKGLVIIH